MKHSIAALGGLLGVALSPAEAHAEPAEWGSESAWTLPKGRIEVGLLSASRYGVSDRVEVGAHPLWFFVLPQIEAKVAWAQFRNVRFATRSALAYPTLFLNLVAKEGTLGLLPQGTRVPQALLIENSALLSIELASWLLPTGELGLTVAPRESHELPLLDFPFLYQRFAALYGAVVPHAKLASEGALGRHFGYAVSVQVQWFSLDADETGGLGSAWAFEEALRIDYFIQRRLRLSAGVRATQAEFPIGSRNYLLPTLDLRAAF